ncbi:MAG TPA: hypothetical protein VFU14_16085 [Acidimicrobiales bacterium]|nr:hypothetical protein [Acidimicrobiales bacterium]
MRRRLVRLVLPSPDRRRVLARPNGLAGWALPAVPVELDGDCAPAWTEQVAAAAARVVGAPVHVVRLLGDDAWEVEADARVPSVGTTWIAPDEAGRLGADAAVVESWSALDPPDG